ncbi:MAG TPA: DUF4124 domain-containing protein [Burkholderiales bacterium]
MLPRGFRVALLLLCCIALPASAQLYKWTDANGRTQYSDRPPMHQQAKKISRSGVDMPVPAPAANADEASKTEGDTHAGTESAAPSAPQTIAEKEQAFRKRRMEAEEARQKQAKLDEEKRAKDESCQRTRNYLKSVEGGRRIARTNDKGETEILDEKQIQQEAERARSDLSTHCS